MELELKHSEEKGVYALATRDFSVGDIILEEEPLVVNNFTASINPQIEELCKEHKLQSNFLYRAITTCAQTEEVQQRVLTLYCPGESHYTTPEAKARYHQILACVHRAFEEGLLPKGVELERFVKFVFIWDVNSVRLDQSFHHAPGCSALFERFSRLCHSCFPNAVHFSRNQHQFVRCLRPIKKGEEITICYQSDATSMCSAVERNRELLMAEGFVCGCIRCKHDYSRMFCCRHCDGAVLVSRVDSNERHSTSNEEGASGNNNDKDVQISSSENKNAKEDDNDSDFCTCVHVHTHHHEEDHHHHHQSSEESHQHHDQHSHNDEGGHSHHHHGHAHHNEDSHRHEGSAQPGHSHHEHEHHHHEHGHHHHEHEHHHHDHEDHHHHHHHHHHDEEEDTRETFGWEVKFVCTACKYEYTPREMRFALDREEFLKQAVQDESWITELWDRMFAGEDMRGEVAEAMSQCREYLDEQHWVFQKLLELSREMEDFLDNHAAALSVGRRLLAFSRKAMGDVSFTEGMHHERLGNTLEAMGNWAEAYEEYKEAHRIYGLMLPLEHDFIKQAAALMHKVNKRLKTIGTVCPFCGS